MTVPKDTKKVNIVDASGGRHEPTQDVDGIGDTRTSDTKVDRTANKMAIASGIRKEDTICGMKTKVKLHGSVHRAVIN